MRTNHQTPYGVATAYLYRRVNSDDERYHGADLEPHYIVKVEFGNPHPQYGAKDGAEQQTALTINRIPYAGYAEYKYTPNDPGWQNGLAYGSVGLHRDPYEYNSPPPTDNARRAVYNECRAIAEQITQDTERLRAATLAAIDGRIKTLQAERVRLNTTEAQYRQLRGKVK